MSSQSFIYNPTVTTSAATGDGYSVPRTTTVGRLAIVFGASDKGMMVYDTTLNNLFIWDGAAWVSVPDSGDSSDTQVIYNDNGVLVGDAGLTYQKTVQRLTVGTSIDIWRGQAQDPTSTAVGQTALNTTTAAATGNTTIGYRAMYRATTGTDNVVVGKNAASALPFTGSFNTVLGSGTATGLTTGSGNVVVGGSSGIGLTTGSNNIAVGNSAIAGAATVTGADNIGIGRTTLGALTSGANNIAIGINTANLTTTGSNNIAIGNLAGERNISAADTIAIGQSALKLNTIVGNVAIGAATLSNNTVGSNNTAVGYNSLRSVVAQDNCTALGYQAARAVNSADVTAIGSNALALSTGGSQNTAVGSQTLGGAIVTGQSNTAVGYGAGFLVTSGASNTLIGTDAGNTLTIGHSNIVIGRGAVTGGAATTNELSIGSATYFVGTNGAAATYYATATAGAVVLGAAQGFIRILLNGTFVKIPVYGN